MHHYVTKKKMPTSAEGFTASTQDAALGKIRFAIDVWYWKVFGVYFLYIGKKSPVLRGIIFKASATQKLHIICGVCNQTRGFKSLLDRMKVPPMKFFIHLIFYYKNMLCQNQS